MGCVQTKDNLTSISRHSNVRDAETDLRSTPLKKLKTIVIHDAEVDHGTLTQPSEPRKVCGLDKDFIEANHI